MEPSRNEVPGTRASSTARSHLSNPSDLVSLRVPDFALGNRILPRAMVIQRKTQRSVQFNLTEPTRDLQPVDPARHAERRGALQDQRPHHADDCDAPRTSFPAAPAPGRGIRRRAPEKMDGTGYPRCLKPEDISISARVMAIADIFEALTAADRPYKPSKKPSEAIKIMGFMVVKHRHIDPDLFQLFLKAGVYRLPAVHGAISQTGADRRGRRGGPHAVRVKPATRLSSQRLVGWTHRPTATYTSP